MRVLLLVLAFVVGCGTSPAVSPPPTAPATTTPPNPPGPPITGPLTRHEVGAPSTARCLPVVSDACGCVYACGIGWADGSGYEVHHRFWDSGRATLHATVSPWCVSGACTDAFHADIVCDGICPPRAADTTCHFAGDACVGQ